ncbi:MAG: nickel pincer cofactor biosynthesis protein LarC [Nitrospirae bacterium]|nr:nickel pincer cofactor biosynthesis protein LarC [Nitrospirota bacterium]
MKIAFFDCFAGISGDMCLGALVDAGVSVKELGTLLKKLRVSGYSLEASRVSRCGLTGTKVDVVLDKGLKVRPMKWKNLESVINGSDLPEKIKSRGLQVFRKLFEAEAKVHGEGFKEVHLHELGGIDCMVDIFGTLMGLELLGVRKVYASPINLGSGRIKTMHGMLPVPAPATSELLKGYPVYASGIPFELTTPTGAVILAGLEAETPSVPSMRIERIGYGAGNRDLEDMPNMLRIIIGETTDSGGQRNGRLSDTEVVVVETNIDDMNPQLYEDITDKLLKAGALDVFLENIIMKKGRPAVKMTVITDEQKLERLTSLIFRETTTIGLRFFRAGRRVLDREIRKVRTRFGEVRIKISRLDGTAVNVSPEYDDLKALSKKTGQPIKMLSEAVTFALKELETKQ